MSGEALGRTFEGFWPALVIAHQSAPGLAWLCYRRQVRYGADVRERVAWPLFEYRFSRSWPKLEGCPRCGTVVPQNRVDCAACHADFGRRHCFAHEPAD